MVLVKQLEIRAKHKLVADEVFVALLAAADRRREAHHAQDARSVCHRREQIEPLHAVAQ